jgi:hypothetical protein
MRELNGTMEGNWRSPAKTHVQSSEKCTVGRCTPSVKSLLPKTLSNPVISDLEVLNGCLESNGDGSSSLHVRFDLQEIKKLLTNIKCEVDSGLKRVELALFLLEQREHSMGFGERQNWGRQFFGREDKAGELGYLKSKKKKRKQKGLLGPKLGLTSVSGTQVEFMRQNLHRGELPRQVSETRSFQVGETFEVGVACAAGLIGLMLVLQSIMGKFGWVRKELWSEVEDVDLGSSATEDGESELGLGSNEVGTSLQKVPAAKLGSFGLLSVSGTPSTSLGVTAGDFVAIRLVPASLGAMEDGESELGLGSNKVGTSL